MSGKSTYTPEIAQAILAKLINGETLTKICEASTMPSRQTVSKWLALNPSFLDAYMRAREAGVLLWADDIIDIADDTGNDYYEDEEGNKRYDPEAVQRSKLRIESRKWLMSKLGQNVFGDKVEVKVEATVSDLTDAQLIEQTTRRMQALGITISGPLLPGAGIMDGSAKDITPDGDDD